MRLKEIYFICKKNCKDIESALQRCQRFKRNGNISIEQVGKILEKPLKELKEIVPLEQNIGEIQSLIERMKEEILNEAYDLSRQQLFLEKLKLVKSYIRFLIDICESLGYEQYEKDEHGFSIKVPQNSELLDFSKIVSEFNFILNQCPILQNDESKINLRKVDVGSVWMDFVIVGSAAVVLLNNMAAFIDKCIAIWSHKKTCEQQIEQLKKMKLDNSLMEGLIKTYGEVTKSLKNSIVKELSVREMDFEEISRMEVCIDKMIVLFDKGLEVHTSIEQKDVQPLFPMAQQWEQLQTKKIEMIESTDNDNKE